jgi:anti-anti-sigma factor
MEITVSKQQGKEPVTVFHIHGEIAADSAGQLLAEAERSVGEGTRNLLLDLSSVPYIGSFGIRALSRIIIMLHQSASDQSEGELRETLRSGGPKSKHLKLLNPNRQVSKVLETTGIDLVLDSYYDQEKAIESF